MSLNTKDLLAILPFIIIVAWAILLLLAELIIPRERKGIMAVLTGIGLLVALVVAVAQVGGQTVAFNGMIVYDGFAVFLSVLFLGSGLAAVALSYDYLKRMEVHRNEFYILLLFSISGMLLMAMAADLILVFMALELLSIPLYVLAGFALPRQDSEEAALKYFLLGAFAGGFVVYGVALVFGATGSTALARITASISAGSANLAFLAVGAALILVGFGFKVAAVPFHMWTPDVYQGSPSPVTAFMAVCAKAAGFAALLRVFVTAFPAIAQDITPILWVLSALTMILGNVVAIAQSNIKRMLAYSSIAQAGYILMALVPYGNGSVSQDAIASALFYLLAYAVTTFGAWAVVIALEQSEGRGLELDDYAGLAHKYPALAAAMTVFMLSLTGIPPTLGFVAKFYLFRTVIEGGYIGLAIIGGLTSLVSAYYYLRVVVIMYMRDGQPEIRRESWLAITAFTAAIATVVLAIFSTPLFQWASQAIMMVF
jgi:NADH-quinone oxidoreductase subunit N